MLRRPRISLLASGPNHLRDLEPSLTAARAGPVLPFAFQRGQPLIAERVLQCNQRFCSQSSENHAFMLSDREASCRVDEAIGD